MAAKLLHSLADDNPDLQKQIGCMTGIFQIFDRQQFVSGRRPNQRRLLPPPPGNSKYSNGCLEADYINGYNRETLEKNANRYANEKQRASTESSRASFSSSSRSSSFSSLDCGRTGQPETASFDRIIFPETPSRDPVITTSSASPKMGRLSIDLRDVVKDSMYRDSRGLSVQTTTKEEGSSHSLKQKDSPRPLQLSKLVDRSSGVGMKGMQDVPADFKESLRVLANIRDAPWYYNDREFPITSSESKEGSSLSISRDGPRFSYDGRESSRKIKDLPRLSLDSRESSARSSIMDSKFRHLSGNMADESNERVANVLQPSRPSSVVAKLMGLDILPDTKPSNESHLGTVNTYSFEDRGSPLPPLRTHDGCKPIRLPKSPRNSRKEPTSPRWRSGEAVMKPVSTSKFPIEPAPWKHLDGGRVSPKKAPKQKSSATTLSTSPSVYGEIEKRLKDIEFKQSGKDLRALKQILEAMQAKGFMEVTKEQHSLNLVNKRDDEQRYGSEMNAGVMSSNDSRTNRATSKFRGNYTSRTMESPIVIMKPARLVQKSGVPASSIVPIDEISGLRRTQNSEVTGVRRDTVTSKMAKDQTSRDNRREQDRREQAAPFNRKTSNNRNLRVAQAPAKSPQGTKDSTASSSKNSGSISPRLQQHKKVEFDKRSRPPTPPSDFSKSRRQANRQSTESVSPGGRRRPKTTFAQQNDERLRERSSDSRNVSSLEDNSFVESETNVILEQRTEIEVACSEQPEDTASCQSPSLDDFRCSFSGESKNVDSLRFSEVSIGDLSMALEQPSPVSVLDSYIYMEDSPSPLKQTAQVLRVDVPAEPNDCPTGEVWNTVDDDLTTGSPVLELPSEISRKKLQNVDDLVQKLRRLNSTHDEARTDYIASLCENTNPDHRYISEILLASGLLLRDLTSGLTSFQLHPSGHPINPELFFVLEQTKASSLLAKGENDEIALAKTKPEKFHRKLIFDAVNELLAGKLALVGSPAEPWLKAEKLAKKTLNAQKLLRELCAEIELLLATRQAFSIEEEEDTLKSILWEDVMNKSDNWTNFQGQVSGIVLDVERYIFKELVDEIVHGELSAVGGKTNRRCRQLFPQ